MADALPILIADDQRDVVEALRLLLKAEGLPCLTASSPEQALELARTRELACVLTDLNYTRDTTSGQEGLDLIEKLHALDPELPVVAMTAWGTIDLAVRAMQRGAGDFIEKPWDNRRLTSVLRNQLALGAARRESRRLAREIEILRGSGDDDFVAESRAMQPVLELIRRVGPTTAHVLVLGENGTGKGVAARLIHASSARADRPFVKVNMGGIAESVFESEMFGHVRGAFTDARSDRVGRFEVADGGTLFLDEVGNIPVSQQPKLLRVLEDGELERVGSSKTLRVDVRLISATNADLAAEVARGAFRKDLLFRLNTVELRLPPLRERREDIVPMARRFLARAGARYGRIGMTLGANAERALLAYAWPGNVRELSHVLERAVLMGQGERVESLEFGLGDATLGSGAALAAGGEAAAPGDDLDLDRSEERMVRRALERSEGNVQRAAELLGLSRAALYRRFEKFGIQV
ncbi:MAG TPA: sigma-54 dependent transcriptional regulator [Pseudomonadota bacterium]|nr:sigma-54 dependent transcriptional regulator [Pseudomonadota bacterium]HQY35449.1 sigma-54 dependent transcriptional regulator [Pseudomonadota bacterium]HRA36213.1 sigma-54 dependent transcriptional regulator [Pseudomonadota bacterium]